MSKRGASGLSRVIAVNKPTGMSSHDVVNAVRRIYGERRVGHTGTLDPMASGVLAVCVGPATRLDAYLVDHDKSYRLGIEFGMSTTTDDAEGDPLMRMPVPERLFNQECARKIVEGLVGCGMQMPPVYSAVKVAGQKSYEAARKGKIIDLEPRPYEVFSAKLESVDVLERDGDPVLVWHVAMDVSKGTYMRSIARDLGRSLGTCAHVCSLERTRVGNLELKECLSIADLERYPDDAVVDPLRLLGCRWAFVDAEGPVKNGGRISVARTQLNLPVERDPYDADCCSSQVYPSSQPPSAGELVGMVCQGELKALYEYDQAAHAYRARCVFAQGVERGSGI